MKAVASQAARFIAPRNGEAARGRGKTVVEGGVEAGDLGQVGLDRPYGKDRREASI